MTATENKLYDTIESPIGPLLLAGDERALRIVDMRAGPRPRAIAPAWRRSRAAFGDARTQLGEFFAGGRTSFELELDPVGTPFQRGVWNALSGIPHGETISYGELAERVGRPGSARAVGSANGRNPLAIVVPCHRVIGSDGALHGFAGGIERKRWLLAHEGALSNPAG
jgi:methylated-DNA-[protein]-cysteine S-methyltransferase